MRCILPCCLPLQATTCKGMLNVAKVQHKLRVASGVNLPWNGSMEWNMEENLAWNGRFSVWNGNEMEENCQCGI